MARDAGCSMGSLLSDRKDRIMQQSIAREWGQNQNGPDEGLAAMSEDNSNGHAGNRDIELLAGIRKLPSLTWKLLKLFPSWYLAVCVMTAYAFWEARTPVTMIAPLQVSKPNLPFTVEIVADAVQDGLKKASSKPNFCITSVILSPSRFQSS
jgi:hypothetical protein